MEYHSEHVMNLANSIIGVSILAMPYCFKECGIVLSILLLFVSSIISRLSCHFLLKSAVITRRKTFEFLAFHAFGPLGKFIIEIGIIGFMLGTCIAFFVVMGDLGPEIVSEISGSPKSSAMRTSILMALALFCVLPLGLLRKVDSLAGVSKATIGFYCCLVLKIVVESTPHFVSGAWLGNVELWRPAGILQCIPIFSMALSCQTQLFEIYQAMPNASLEKMNETIRIATNICTFVYIFVGMFGYIAFYKTPFTGNILLSFKPSAMTDAMKLGFVLSLAFSFPLVIFPCRASLYSLIYKRIYSIHEGSASNYIPEGKFKSLTFIIVFFSLLIGLLIPSIELVLGLIGSTIGVLICVVFPVTCFICVSPKNTNERIVAQLILFFGVMIMVLGTYANLYAIEEIHVKPTEKLEIILKENVLPNDNSKMEIHKAVTALNLPQNKPPDPPIDLAGIKPPPGNPSVPKEVRHEPPQPEEPPENVVSANALLEKEVKQENAESKAEVEAPEAEIAVHDKQGPVVEPVFPHESENEEKKPKLEGNSKESPQHFEEVKQNPLKPEENIPANNSEKKDSDRDTVVVSEKQKKTDEVDIEAIKKEEHELKEQEKAKDDEEAKKQALLDTLKKQNEVQMQIVQQQQQLIEAIKQQQQVLVNEKQKGELEKVQQKKLEAVKQIETIAKQAIESLGVKEPGNKVDENVKDKQAVESKEKEKEKLKDAEAPVKLVPLPLAISNNLTMDRKPRHKSEEKIPSQEEDKIKPGGAVLKQNEVNINKVGNMNINIKHEINVNVDGNTGPQNLVELLNGKPRNVKKDIEKNNNSMAAKNSNSQKDDAHQRSERSIDFEEKNNVDSGKADFLLNKSDSPLAEIVNKLSEANLALKDMNIPNVKPAGRDLKYFQAKI